MKASEINAWRSGFQKWALHGETAAAKDSFPWVFLLLHPVEGNSFSSSQWLAASLEHGPREKRNRQRSLRRCCRQIGFAAHSSGPSTHWWALGGFNGHPVGHWGSTTNWSGGRFERSPDSWCVKVVLWVFPFPTINSRMYVAPAPRVASMD